MTTQTFRNELRAAITRANDSGNETTRSVPATANAAGAKWGTRSTTRRVRPSFSRAVSMTPPWNPRGATSTWSSAA